MNNVIDINAMAQSALSMVMNMQQTATQLIGLDCLWCRALPYENSEDIIIQEYTLSNVECPQKLRIITDKTDYQPGNFNVDLWGVSYEQPLEISVDINTWQSVYGKNTQPQKGDIVYIQLINKLFEVGTATVVYTLTEMPTSFKCSLRKYTRTASRRESEDLKISIDELTVTQETLFGDDISREVADTVVERETSYDQSTHVDPIKDFDIDSIVMEDVIGEHGNLISNAYYSFKNATKDVVYDINADFDINDEYNHWIYTCWFRFGPLSVVEKNFKIKGVYLKDRNNYWFDVDMPFGVDPGEEVVIYRGNVIRLNAIVELRECEEHMFVLKIPTNDVLRASKKLTNWWQKGVWKMQKKTGYEDYHLISGYSGDDRIIDINAERLKFNIRFGNVEESITLVDNIKLFNNTAWHYMALEVSPTEMRLRVSELQVNDSETKYTLMQLTDETKRINLQNFQVDRFELNNKGINLNICNIRFYEDIYELGDSYKYDLYSQVTRNANKLIFVDTPNVADKMSFITGLR